MQLTRYLSRARSNNESHPRCTAWQSLWQSADCGLENEGEILNKILLKSDVLRCTFKAFLQGVMDMELNM